MLHSRNPLVPPVEHRAVAPVTHAPLVLRLNGEWLLGSSKEG